MHIDEEFELAICTFTLSFHRSEIFCKIHKSKLRILFCLNFCLQGNHKVSVYNSNLTIHLYLTTKNGKLYTIFLHLGSILTPNPNVGACSTSLHP